MSLYLFGLVLVVLLTIPAADVVGRRSCRYVTLFQSIDNLMLLLYLVYMKRGPSSTN